jgi:hypothetical protein
MHFASVWPLSQPSLLVRLRRNGASFLVVPWPVLNWCPTLARLHSASAAYYFPAVPRGHASVSAGISLCVRLLSFALLRYRAYLHVPFLPLLLRVRPSVIPLCISFFRGGLGLLPLLPFLT